MSNPTVQAAAEGMPISRTTLSDLYGILLSAKSMAMITRRLTETELIMDPAEPGRTYALVDEQIAMLQHAAFVTEDLVDDAIRLVDPVYVTKEQDDLARGIIPPSERDPLLDLIESYRRGREAEEAASDLSDEKAAKLADATWKPSWSILASDKVPAPTTLKGVEAAVRLVRDENRSGTTKMTEHVLTALIAFFDGGAV